MPMDVVRVNHSATGKSIFSSIVTAFGYIADVGNTAQNYRHLGPLRYLVTVDANGSHFASTVA